MKDKRLRILILEDSAGDIRLIDRELRRAGFTFSLLPVATKEDFLRELDSMPDVILSDYSLPSYDGLSALDAARGRCPDVPFIFVSGTIGEDFAKESLIYGATDYVSKDRLDLLVPALQSAVGRRGEGIEPVAGDTPERRKDGPAEYGQNTDRPTVLIIDDDTNLRKTLADILNSKGYEARTAKDGAEGLGIFEKSRCDLVLIDLGLPDMSGMEVLNRIKYDSPSTQAIILTGNATLDSAIGATNKGAFSYLVKPCEPEQLLLHIRRAIEKQRAEDKIVRDSSELRIINSELKTLYNISLSISRTIEMKKLFPEILRTLTSIEILSLKGKAAIFLVEEGRLRMSCNSGFSPAEAALCSNIKTGDCLCGLAALKGEIVLSKDSDCDPRHTIRRPAAPPHGHIIVPLKSMTRVVGVLCLYTRPEAVTSIKVLHMLFSIGNQLGMAIANSALYEEAKSSSFRDPLTGLANRRLLDVILGKSFARAARFGTALSAVMIDIDHFKKYNDTYGHVAGDKILADTARIIRENTREGDIAVRYGGEEFLVLLHEVDTSCGFSFAEKLRRTVEAKLGITISLGVSSYSRSMSKGENLIRDADEALYRAKQNGRNRVETGGGNDRASA